MILPPSRAIDDVRFNQAVPKVLQNDQVEIQVKSYALNFKDVLNILKPSTEFESYNSVGIDFAGIVMAIADSVGRWKVGDVATCKVRKPCPVMSFLLKTL
jgi:NADPH:quinone reductase-like Zn-dependent oxidoreductase